MFTCDLVCILKKFGGISIYSNNGEDLSYLMQFGGEGHLKQGAVAIPFPYIKWPKSNFHRPVDHIEFIGNLKELRMNASIIEEQRRKSHYHKDVVTQLKELPSMSTKLLDYLNEKGIKDIYDLAKSKVERLGQDRISNDLAKKLIKEAKISKDRYSKWTNGFGKPNLEYEENQEFFQLIWDYNRGQILNSGCKKFDEIFKTHGLETKSLFHFFGAEDVGLTTLTHQLLCRAVIPINKGGLGGIAVYFDNGEYFDKNLIKSIANRFDINPKKVFNNIALYEVISTDDLIYGNLTELPEFLKI